MHVLTVETKEDVATNEIVTSRRSSIIIDFCPDSPTNLDKAQIEYLTPASNRISTPIDVEEREMHNVGDLPEFLQLPTCTMRNENKLLMVFAYHENDTLNKTHESITTSLVPHSEKKKDEIDEDLEFFSSSSFKKCLARIPSSLYLPMLED